MFLELLTQPQGLRPVPSWLRPVPSLNQKDTHWSPPRSSQCPTESCSGPATGGAVLASCSRAPPLSYTIRQRVDATSSDPWQLGFRSWLCPQNFVALGQAHGLVGQLSHRVAVRGRARTRARHSLQAYGARTGRTVICAAGAGCGRGRESSFCHCLPDQQFLSCWGWSWGGAGTEGPTFRVKPVALLLNLGTRWGQGPEQN